MAISRKQSTEDIFSFTLRTYGSLIYVNEVMNLNSFNSYADFDNLPIGTFVKIKGRYYGASDLTFRNNKVDYYNYSGRNQKKVNQSLFDYVLTQYGTLEGMSDFLLANDIDGIGYKNGNNNYELKPIKTPFKVNVDKGTTLTDILERGRTYVATSGSLSERIFGDYDDSYNEDFY